ncbi:MAG TPA: FIST N-terminal domain-containing protein [Tepidisphaeraceae bacterium]|nr:FIST N-terminal domain-containing protein [Tepidisphaeraceae bacterium]
MKRITIFATIVLLAGIVCWRFVGGNASPQTARAISIAPTPKPIDAPATGGGLVKHNGDGFTGCGWSDIPQTSQALADAASHALDQSSGSPDLTVVYYNPQHDPQKILDALQHGDRPMGKVFGETTHSGVLLPDGYHTAKQGVLGMLAMRQPGTKIGVGGASFDEASPREAAKLALSRAYKDAGDNAGAPKMILLSVTLPHEEEVLAGLQEATGPNIPLIGGTAAGSVDEISRKKMSNWSIIANDKVIKNGLAVAVFYSDTSFGWSYGGGYRRTSTSGIVTKCKQRLILEIDGRPAADVYNEWLGGRVYEAQKRGDNIVNFCNLYPICRITGTYNQFIRAWPAEDPTMPGALRTGSTVNEGDKIYLSEGTWNLLLNHFASVPRLARESTPGLSPSGGLFIYCGSALECIPNEARPQMAFLVGKSMNDLPWIGVFSWGEQGYIPGAGNLHSNLTSGTVFFPESNVTKP